MAHLALPLALIAGLFVSMLAFVELGRRIGLNKKFEGLGAVEGGVFGLMGLLIAFTFGSAAVRFETRRSLAVEEVNDIGTAYLRLDLLQPAAQAKLRDAFRRYVDSRIAVYEGLPDLDVARVPLARMAELQNEIWRESVTACGEVASSAPAMLLLPALNTMFDITTTRTVAFQSHQPTIIFVMLALAMLACSLLAGFEMGIGSGRNWLHVVCFAAVLTIAFFVILDLEYPRVGLLRLDWMDQLLRDLRSGMA
jgi:hypothetical protein